MNKHLIFKLICYIILHQAICQTMSGVTEISVYDGNYKLFCYPIDFYDAFFKLPEDVSITGKLIYIDNSQSILYYLQKYNKLYNSQWIVMVEDETTMRLLIDFVNNSEVEDKGSINAILINELISQGSYYSEYVPIFILDNEMCKELRKNFEISNEKGNYFLNISTINSSVNFPKSYLLAVTIVSASLSLVLTITWHLMVYKFYRTHALPIQKVLTILPYIKSILCALLVYYISTVIQDRTGSSSSLSKVYLDTIISTLFSIFKTIFWFILILVSNGWQLYKQTLSREEMRKFIGIYIFVYLMVCLDQIIDLVFDGRLLNFQASELKNFFAYTVLAVYIVYKSRTSLKFLRNKISYARVLAPQYIPALKLKQKLLILHIVIGILYSSMFLITIILQKHAFFKYYSVHLSLVNYSAIDLFILMLYLINFRPRVLPQHFNVDYGSEDLSQQGNIYSCKLLRDDFSSHYGIESGPSITKADIRKVQRENHPLVVINPTFDESRRNSSEAINNSIDKDNSSSEFKSKMIERISVGFYNKD